MNRLIIVPIVGAIIGYVTNWIAVKMLFHPRKAIYIGKWKLPFTPGVIPKGQARLARAIGRMVETQLLTKDVILERLTSDTVEANIKARVKEVVDAYKRDADTVKEKALANMTQVQYEKTVEDLEKEVSHTIYVKAVEMNLGEIVTEKVVETIKEKIGGSFLGAMLGSSLDSMTESMSEQAEDKINQYIQDEGYEYILEKVQEESGALQNKRVSEGFLWLEDHGVALEDIAVNFYHRLITDNISEMLSLVDFAGMVEQKINDMKVEEVEELVLSIMQKELGTIVNLGALIGLILGFINVAIMYI